MYAIIFYLQATILSQKFSEKLKFTKTEDKITAKNRCIKLTGSPEKPSREILSNKENTQKEIVLTICKK